MRAYAVFIAAITCPEDKILCPGRERCIFTDAVCDRFNDCPGGTDEDLELCGLYSHVFCIIISCLY